jgi:DJ-1/PfpI family
MSIPDPPRPAAGNSADPEPDKPLKIALVRSPGYTALDIIGPFPGPRLRTGPRHRGTGSIYLAAAGILDGQEATTHWARAEKLERLGARYTEQRVVEHGKVITVAGVSASIDMALTLSPACTARSSRRRSSSASNATPTRPSAPGPRRRYRPRWSMPCDCGEHASSARSPKRAPRRLLREHRDEMPRRTRSIGTHAGVDCPQRERKERTWPQSRAKTRRPARCRR